VYRDDCRRVRRTRWNRSNTASIRRNFPKIVPNRLLRIGRRAQTKTQRETDRFVRNEIRNVGSIAVDNSKCSQIRVVPYASAGLPLARRVRVAYTTPKETKGEKPIERPKKIVTRFRSAMFAIRLACNRDRNK